MVILPIDLFPGESKEEGPVCSVSRGEAVAWKQYFTSSLAATAVRDAYAPALIALFYCVSVKSKHNPLGRSYCSLASSLLMRLCGVEPQCPLPLLLLSFHLNLGHIVSLQHQTGLRSGQPHCLQ